MTPLDPNDANQLATAAHAATLPGTASEYWNVLLQRWPVAVVGGCMGVLMHYKDIFTRPRWRGRLALVIVQWNVGAAAAMASAILVSVAWPETLSYRMEAEMGLGGFLGGVTGMHMFRFFARRFLGVNIEMRENEWDGVERRTAERTPHP